MTRDETPVFIVKVNEDFPTEKQTQAFIRMAEAAPDMLEALEWAEKVIGDEKMSPPVLSAIQAAISKAKGL